MLLRYAWEINLILPVNAKRGWLNYMNFMYFFNVSYWTALFERLVFSCKVQYLSTYIEHHSVCPLSELGPPNPSPPSECGPPRTKGWGGGHNRLRLRGWRSPNSDDWRNCITLCLLCECTSATRACFPLVWGVFKLHGNVRQKLLLQRHS
jgi:hypothetical protein